MKRLLLLSLCLVLAIVQIAVGAEVKDAESATHGSDSSNYRIVDTYSFPGFKVIQFTLPVLSVYSYLLVSDGEALLVDPVRDISFYLETAKKEGARIKGLYLTHSHADFVAGHTEIKEGPESYQFTRATNPVQSIPSRQWMRIPPSKSARPP